jgi:hypothetical protein
VSDELEEFDARVDPAAGMISVSLCWDPFDLTRAEAELLYRKLGEALKDE